MKKPDTLWQKLLIGWEKFKELPLLLKYSIHGFFTVLVLLFTFMLARLNPKVEKYANSIFDKYFPDSTAVVPPSTPTNTSTVVVIPPKIDSSKISNSNVGNVGVKLPVENHHTETVSPTVKPHRTENTAIIGFDLIEINIHYSKKVSEDFVSEFETKLENRYKKEVHTVQRDADENDSKNVIRLPIKNEVLRKKAAKSVTKLLGIQFSDVKYNETLSTIIYIGKI